MTHALYLMLVLVQGHPKQLGLLVRAGLRQDAQIYFRNQRYPLKALVRPCISLM